MKRQYKILIFLFIVAPFLANGQTMNEAKKWLSNGEFNKAKLFFETKYQSEPNNVDANFCLGQIYLHEGEINKAKHFLEFAESKKENNAHLYLGILYSKLYKFNEAKNHFDKYEKSIRRIRGEAGKTASEKLSEERTKSDKIQRLIEQTEDIQIIDSVIVAKKNFLSAYKLDKMAGKLQMSPDTISDLPTTLFTNEKKSKIYYSNGSKISGQKIYTKEKIIDKFTSEKELPDPINEEGNQAFPFVMPDGLTMYFASTSHNSIGGYDLFVTRFNLETNSYLTPSHLSMPFNSQFNDYMMAIDEEKGIGWFASDRFQDPDSVCVYTFIPAEKVNIIDSTDQEYMTRRALIYSIKESWKPNADYSKLLKQINVAPKNSKDKEQDFQFVINDHKTYNKLSDFKNERAKNLFSKALTKQKELDENNKKLEYMRNQIARTNTNNTIIKNDVLSMEKKSESLIQEIKKLQFEARNEEIKNIYN